MLTVVIRSVLYSFNLSKPQGISALGPCAGHPFLLRHGMNKSRLYCTRFSCKSNVLRCFIQFCTPWRPRSLDSSSHFSWIVSPFQVFKFISRRQLSWFVYTGSIRVTTAANLFFSSFPIRLEASLLKTAAAIVGFRPGTQVFFLTYQFFLERLLSSGPALSIS